MIGLIVTGHANLGSGMTSSVNLIAGEQEAYRYVDFLPTYGTEELTEEIAKAMDELKDCEGIIIFTDLMGGSPFNVAAFLVTVTPNHAFSRSVSKSSKSGRLVRNRN